MNIHHSSYDFLTIRPLDYGELLEHGFFCICFRPGPDVRASALSTVCVPLRRTYIVYIDQLRKRDYVTWAAWWFVWRSSHIVSCVSNEQNRYIYIYSLTATREAAFDCHVRLTHCSVDETIVLWLLFVWAVFFFLLFISHCNSPIVCWYTFLAFYIRSLCPRVRSYPNEMLFRLLSI